ncbi:hypothetical protein L6164_023550 [Bauhinia variegata]|uniref:Uncharacterized protein n=1 Tax=Bauhinia variegata TaxID=167791 RepID=A0ACB9MJY2_BAUVA|nr:hypothetical protein L6164_023550 [Bauhinia variegata]
MVFLWFLPFSLYSLLLCIQFSFTVTNCFPHVQLANAKFHEDEYAALLEFKASFVISTSASLNPLSYPKIEFWIENIDLCSWHGVECDDHTGYVIGLHLGSSQLQGPLNSNSTLFHLMKLQSLSLSDNNLSFSQIPSRLGDLSSLKYLNLSQSKFSGEIPLEISKFPNCGSIPPSLGNLTQLTVLELFSNNFTGYIPSLLSKLSQLHYLSVGAPPSGSDDDQPRSLFDFGWKVVLVGYGCGLVVGVVIGSTEFRETWMAYKNL